MKKFSVVVLAVAVGLAATARPAMADGWRHHGGGHGGSCGSFLVGAAVALTGLAVLDAVLEPRTTVVYAQPPVAYAPPAYYAPPTVMTAPGVISTTGVVTTYAGQPAVVYSPSPAYYAPPPVYYAPPAVVYAPPIYYGGYYGASYGYAPLSYYYGGYYGGYRGGYYGGHYGGYRGGYGGGYSHSGHRR